MEIEHIKRDLPSIFHPALNWARDDVGDVHAGMYIHDSNQNQMLNLWTHSTWKKKIQAFIVAAVDYWLFIKKVFGLCQGNPDVLCKEKVYRAVFL